MAQPSCDELFSRYNAHYKAQGSVTPFLRTISMRSNCSILRLKIARAVG